MQAYRGERLLTSKIPWVSLATLILARVIYPAACGGDVDCKGIREEWIFEKKKDL